VTHLFILKENHRLDQAIAEELPEQLSRSQIQKLVKEGKVTSHGKPILKSSFKTTTPIEIAVYWEEKPEYTLTPVNLDIPILYQDNQIAVIHKPAGITVHPGSGTGDDTLVHSLIAQIDTLSEGSDKLRPGIVHRLDRDTEGLMVIAKTPQSHAALGLMFRNRNIKKTYTALVWGRTSDKKSFNGYVGRNPKDRKRMLYSETPLTPAFKNALMEYEKVGENEFFSLLKIHLETGRTHQIRVTLTSDGTPVVGDTLYSRLDNKIKNYLADLERFYPEKRKLVSPEQIKQYGLLLIASELAFEHPITKEPLSFQIELPKRFQELLG